MTIENPPIESNTESLAGPPGIPVLKVEIPAFRAQIPGNFHYENNIKLFECLSTLDLYSSDIILLQDTSAVCVLCIMGKNYYAALQNVYAGVLRLAVFFGLED